MRLLVDGEVFALLQPRNDLRELLVELGRLLRRAADDQRRARFVDENRVDFVDEREVELALHQVFDLPGHVVAQVVEADFVVRDVGDVAVIGGAALRGSSPCWMMPTLKPEELIDRRPSTRRRGERDNR